MQDPLTYLIFPFSLESFLSALSTPSCSIEEISGNARVQYLFSYLKELGINTIICETNYIDADYLDDFANFYAKSFEGIPSRCRRLHFFSSEITEEKFRNVLQKPADKTLSDSYKGFIVARPLSTAVIGRSVLDVYPQDGGRRNYTCLRRYDVNLFGVELQINGLAFQEQDTSLAACATVALWSCFQKTKELFSSLAPPPAAITRAANRLLLSARPFPSRGLEIQQICNAIAAVGLDPEFYEVTPDLPLVSTIYSYLALGLPIILVVDIPELGLHAITINGYSIQKLPCLISEGAEVGKILPSLIGRRIDEFYGHDDQNGPYCRLKLIAADQTTHIVRLHGAGCWEKKILKPVAIIAPVYPKIRTGFREILKSLPKITVALSWCTDPERLEWDIHLMRGNDYKIQIRDEIDGITPEAREEILTYGLPKYIWKCTLRWDSSYFFEMLLDTTAMVRGFPILRLRWQNHQAASQLGDTLTQYMQNSDIAPKLKKLLSSKLLQMLIQSCSPPYTASRPR